MIIKKKMSTKRHHNSRAPRDIPACHGDQADCGTCDEYIRENQIELDDDGRCQGFCMGKQRRCKLNTRSGQTLCHMHRNQRFVRNGEGTCERDDVNGSYTYHECIQRGMVVSELQRPYVAQSVAEFTNNETLARLRSISKSTHRSTAREQSKRDVSFAEQEVVFVVYADMFLNDTMYRYPFKYPSSTRWTDPYATGIRDKPYNLQVRIGDDPFQPVTLRNPFDHEHNLDRFHLGGSEAYFENTRYRDSLDDREYIEIRVKGFTVRQRYYQKFMHEWLNECLVEIKSLGPLKLPVNCEKLFADASWLRTIPNDLDTRHVTNMAKMFNDAPSFNSPAVSDWQTGKVTNMSGMFKRALLFNQPLENWDTGNVTNMSEMFLGARNFNQSLDRWNIKRVTEMFAMFHRATHHQIPGWAMAKDTY